MRRSQKLLNWTCKFNDSPLAACVHEIQEMQGIYVVVPFFMAVNTHNISIKTWSSLLENTCMNFMYVLETMHLFLLSARWKTQKHKLELFSSSSSSSAPFLSVCATKVAKSNRLVRRRPQLCNYRHRNHGTHKVEENAFLLLPGPYRFHYYPCSMEVWWIKYMYILCTSIHSK